MLRSMTGFGASSFDDGTYKIGIEIKAVNNRYRDISIRLPGQLRALEGAITAVLNKYGLRGKIDVFVNFADNSENKKKLSVDKNLLTAYYNSLQEIRTEIKSHSGTELPMPQLTDLAAYPGIINEEDAALDLAAVKPLLQQTVEAAVQEFVSMKEIEGANLAKDLQSRLQKIADYVKAIREAAPGRLNEYRSHLLEAVRGLLAESDIEDSRIVQECAIMADKLDITEEIVRMGSHLKQFSAALGAEGNIGRKLDFIIQEMNRETNTMASKANNAQIAALVVDIKGEIEKIREQVQNIE